MSPPSISTQIVTLLYEKGPLMIKDLAKDIPNPAKSIHTKALELKGMGLVQRDNEDKWSLMPGVTPDTLETGELGGAPPGGKSSTTPPDGIALDQKAMFKKHLEDIGVSPKAALPTIVEIFFAGDINDLSWLNRVLTREAAGFVSPHQRGLIIGWWANTRGLPYSEDDDLIPPPAEPGKGRGRPKAETQGQPFDLGVGWKVGKDRDGDWVALPSGPLSYEDAQAGAERRAAIAAYGGASAAGEDGDEGADEGERRPRRGARPRETLSDYTMRKWIDSMIEGGGRQGGQSDEVVKELRAEIARIKEQQLEGRFERLEGLIANMASRDPWDEYDKMQEMKSRFQGPIVTDQSPAVQIIKDTSDKVDKTLTRLLSVVERRVLSDEFKPEETRSVEERESKAGELLHEAENRDYSRQLRKDAFGR